MALTGVKYLVVAGTLGLLAGPALAQDPAPQTSPEGAMGTLGNARAVFLDRDGNSIGTATLVQTVNGLLIQATIENLPPGPHGFHVHQTGACDAAGGFESAGGHYNPTDAQHGLMVEGGPHAGDFPNQTAGEDGRMVVEVFSPELSLEGGDAPLLDDDGAALVVHATADDYTSQPSGAAGDRIACGVVEMP